jgi:hypothetical protein
MPTRVRPTATQAAGTVAALDRRVQADKHADVNRRPAPVAVHAPLALALIPC